MEQDYKACTRCGEEKPIEEFYKNRRKKDGYASACKKCSNEFVYKWRKENPEKNREKSRKANEKVRIANKKMKAHVADLEKQIRELKKNK